jgi:nucleoside-diphosphate-sugar epimerase
MLRRYGWAPSISLTDGLERTYRWVYDEVKHSLT